MTRRWQDSGWMRATLAAVFAVALSLRLFMPAGVMPVGTSDGLTISLCDGMIPDAATVHGARHGEDDDQPTGDSQSQPCAFVALASAALAGDAGALAPLAMHLGSVGALPPLQAADPERRAFLSPPATGPPTRA